MPLKNLTKYDIILASASPRREQLMKELGLNFRVEVLENVDESYPEDLNPEQIPVYLSKVKAKAGEHLVDDSTLLITADTIVTHENKVFTKPRDHEDAVLLLKKLSGQKHTVITGVCIKTQLREDTFHAITQVYFDKLEDEEIEYYVDTYEPFDKAGAYGIQEYIGYIGIKGIEGSFHNVMGLPIQQLYQRLKTF